MLQHQRPGMYNSRSRVGSFRLEWFLVSPLRQVSACKNNNQTKPLGKYFLHDMSLHQTKRCNHTGVPLLHLHSLVNNFSQAANQQ
ncbi:hypothetical protein EUGRSUZ_H01036 [Eucalyptus grandis]|uniref:Uncharacterized protein n=2 Tax=Eucalyptus grandis TaxID=71139 RepID=A0ACC3JN39_EUCGR|nr:hypothetical protein EUGRSUZ_H01036 [Eucalyptus grandis]